jgi:hypothetical protein
MKHTLLKITVAALLAGSAQASDWYEKMQEDYDRQRIENEIDENRRRIEEIDRQRQEHEDDARRDHDRFHDDYRGWLTR